MTARLSHEDRILWARVARTVTPMKDKADALLAVEPEPEPRESVAEMQPQLSPVRPAVKPDGGRLHHLDSPTRAKLAKGRLPLEARVDLHGLNQAEAHALLLSFLHRAFAQGMRHVLVITGKGASFGSDGILRRAVPAWFATAPFRPLVNGYEWAARDHGGAGALYVRLRRHSDGRGS